MGKRGQDLPWVRLLLRRGFLGFEEAIVGGIVEAECTHRYLLVSSQEEKVCSQ